MVALESLNDDLTELHTNIDKLKKNVNVPYNTLEKQIKIAERLHNTTQLLRKINRFLQLHRKLKETSEYNKQAKIIFELDALVNDKDLMKIEILIDERASVINSKQRLLHIANRDLSNGIQENNENLISSSLEIYRNLDMLNTFLNNQIESYVNDIKQSIKQCFNGADLLTLQKTSIKGSPLSTGSSRLPGKIPALSTSINFRTKLLTGLEWLFTDELFSYCEQTLAINQCLKRITSGYLIDNPSAGFLSKFSKAICNLLKTSFEESPVHVLQNLQQSLPNLLSFFNTLQAKVGKDIDLNKSIFSSLNNGYIEKCAANLKLPATADNILSEEVVDQMLKNATAELTVSLIDQDLLSSVVGILCACNNDLWTKVKSNIKTGSDAEQVLSMPNASQNVNINNANLIFHHQTKMEQMLVTLNLQKKDKFVYDRIKKNIEESKVITLSILNRLKASMVSTINIILLSMHREPSINSDNINISAPSLYMRELQDFLNRSWPLHMSPFNDKAAVSQCAKELSVKIIDLFVQNLSILRPISVKGRQRMRSDCTQLENLIQTIVSDMSTLGNSYRTLRSISTLIVEPPERLIETENNLIPSYVILFMLFGHAAEDLMSPHRGAGWSDEKLIQWLGEHKERERLELISGALQKYRTIIRKKNKTQYDPVYPLISNLLEKCMAPYQQQVPARGLL
jgi:conserved oligomeric Golgi complex subunit 5